MGLREILMWAGVGCAAAAIPILLVIETLNEREHVAAVLAKRNAAAIKLVLARPTLPAPSGVRDGASSFDRALAPGASIRTGSLHDRPVRPWSHPSQIAAAGSDASAGLLTVRPGERQSAAGERPATPQASRPELLTEAPQPVLTEADIRPHRPSLPISADPPPRALRALLLPEPEPVPPLLISADPPPQAALVLLPEPEPVPPLPDILVAAAQPPAAHVVQERHGVHAQPRNDAAATSVGNSAMTTPPGEVASSNSASSAAQVVEFASDRVELPSLPPRRAVAKRAAGKRVTKSKRIAAPLSLMKWSLP